MPSDSHWVITLPLSSSIQRGEVVGLEQVAPQIAQCPALALGVVDLLGQVEQVGHGGDLGGPDAELVEDVRPVVQLVADVEPGGEGRESVELVVPHGRQPAALEDRGEVRVRLDLVACQVGGEVGELVRGCLAEVQRRCPERRHLDPVGQLVAGEQRREDRAVVVAVGGRHGHGGAERLAHRLVEGVVRRRDGAPQRRDRGVAAAGSRDLADRLHQVGRVFREGRRRAADARVVRRDEVARGVGRQDLLQRAATRRAGLCGRGGAAARRE